jgi:predicted phage tail protein
MAPRPAVAGSGGQSGSGSSPKEAPDSLQSTQISYIKDIISAGPIRGLVHPNMQSIALEFTRIQNLDGSNNFATMQDPAHPGNPSAVIPSDLEVHFLTGTQDQLPVVGFESEEATAAEGLKLTFSNPYVREFTNPNLDALRFDIRTPALLKTDKKSGNISGSKIQVKFELNINGGGWVEVMNDTIKGKTTGGFTRSYRIDLADSSKPGPWQIRITRVTKDSTTLKLRNDTFIDSYTEVIDKKLSHPLVSYCATRFDSTQFSSLPSRSFEVYGRIISVPANYDPDTRAYATTGPGTTAGVWDGTFKQAWTQNNSWVCWDLLTDRTNGLGLYVDPAKLSKWDFYRAAQVCDTMVPDGFGGMEPRYTCNTVITGRADAIAVLNDFFGSMNAVPAFIGGQICPVQDRLVDPSEYRDAYGPANVENGDFNFSTTSRKERHTVALIEWNDPADFGRPKTEYVEDQQALLDHGENELHVTGIGITSRGQAHRRGRMMLMQEQLRTEALTYSTGLQGASLRPGDVIPVSVPFRTGTTPYSGRVKVGDTPGVVLDTPVVIEAGKTYTIFLTLTDGSNVEVAVGNTPSTTDTINFVTELDFPPVDQSVWILSASDLKPELFRVNNVKMVDLMKTEITGITYNPAIYDAVETNLTLEPPDTDPRPDPGNCPPIGDVTVQQVASTDITGRLVNNLVITWVPPVNPVDGTRYAFVKEYHVSLRFEDGNWIDAGKTREPSIVIPVGGVGHYEFQILAVNTLGGFSAPVDAEFTVTLANPLPLFVVNGLELIGLAHDTIFEQRDAKFAWRINSPANQTEIQDDLTGAAAGVDDPHFAYFEVRMIVNGLTVWTEKTKTPSFTLTYEKNAEANNGVAQANFRFQVAAWDIFNNHSDSFLDVSNPAPPAPDAFAVSASFKQVFGSWRNPSVVDLAAIHVFESATNDSSTAVEVAVLGQNNTTFTRVVTDPPPATKYYWLKAEDSFGNLSPFSAMATATTGTIGNTDISSFAVDITKMFTNTVALQGAAWFDNQNGLVSAAGYISWSAHTLVYQGALYAIAAGSTNLQYVYWDGVSAVYSASDALPSLTDGQFIIATNANDAGIHDLAWNAMANALIGSAYIANLAVTSAKIQTLVADKIVGGTILGQTIIIGQDLGGIPGVIKSANYVAGVSGWRIYVDAAGLGHLEAYAGIFGGAINVAGKFVVDDATGKVTLGTAPNVMVLNPDGSMQIGGTAGASFYVGLSDPLDSTTFGAIWIGAATFANAPWGVDNQGNQKTKAGPQTGHTVDVGAINGTIAAPVTDQAGAYQGNINLTAPTPYSILFYTLDGTTPAWDTGLNPTGTTVKINAITGVVAISGNITLKAFAVKLGWVSTMLSVAFTTAGGTVVANPALGLAPGYYTTTTGAKNVPVSCATSGSTIFATTDGTTPTHTGATPTGTTFIPGANISVFGNKTIKLIGYKAGMTDSGLTVGTYDVEVGGRGNP